MDSSLDFVLRGFTRCTSRTVAELLGQRLVSLGGPIVPSDQVRRGPDIVYPAGVPYDDHLEDSFQQGGGSWFCESAAAHEYADSGRLYRWRWVGVGFDRALKNHIGERHPRTPEGWRYGDPVVFTCPCKRCTGRRL